MNFIIEGKKKIDYFVNSMKQFDNPYLSANEEQFQLLEMQDSQQLQSINNSEYPAHFLSISQEFFTATQINFRDIHLRFVESTCQNINLQQKVCTLNSELSTITCMIPSNSIYKVLRPLLGQNLKTLQISICYLVQTDVLRTISLQFIVSAQLSVGLFIITKPIHSITSKLISEIKFQHKLITFQPEHCKYIKDAIKNQSITFECDQDQIQITPTVDETLQISFYNAQMKYYNSSLVEEYYDTLKLPKLYNSTIYPMMKFGSKMKEDICVFIDRDDRNNKINIYFAVVTNYLTLFIRQSSIYLKKGDVKQKMFQIDDDILEEIESQHYIQQIKQKQEESKIANEQQYLNFNIQQDKSQQLQISQYEYSQNQLNYEQELSFIPPKVTSSINDQILELLKKSKVNISESTLKQQ